jgi:hypothetical protein
VPPLADRGRIADASAYAGTYRAETGALTLLSEGDRLMVQYGHERIGLESRGEDTFYAHHPRFARFLLRFGRADGQVTELWHGPDWYVHERYTGPATFTYPAEWDAYPGHYRSHNPWRSNFRIVVRKGALLLVQPSGVEEPLRPLAPDLFQCGEEAHSPERLRLDAVIKGQALRANLSGCDYYRFFTP